MAAGGDGVDALSQKPDPGLDEKSVDRVAQALGE